MRHYMLGLLAVMVTILFPTVLAAQSSAEIYGIEMKLFDGDRLVGNPKVTAEAGSPVILTLDRDGGYSMRLTARPAEAAGEVAFDAEIYLQSAGQWVAAARPQMRLQQGEASTLETTRKSAAAGERSKFRFEIEVVNAGQIAAAAGAAPCSVDATADASWLDMMQNLVKEFPAGSGALIQTSNCCENSCLKCCGGRGACCSDPYNCTAGCCT